MLRAVPLCLPTSFLLSSVKGVNFYGPNSEFIVSGSDCGNVFLWSKKETSIVNVMKGDENGVVRSSGARPGVKSV